MNDLKLQKTSSKLQKNLKIENSNSQNNRNSITILGAFAHCDLKLFWNLELGIWTLNLLAAGRIFDVISSNYTAHIPEFHLTNTDENPTPSLRV